MQFDIRYVPAGTSAPIQLAEGEVWLDVGGRLTKQVLDHHFEDSSYQSSAECVFRCPELICHGHAKTFFILHQYPDLDAVFALWLATQVSCLCLSESDYGGLEILIDHISKHDQGFTGSGDPESWWPLVYQLEFGNQFSKEPNCEEFQPAFRFFEATLEGMAQKPIEELSRDLLSENSRKQLEQSIADYKSDLAKSHSLQVKLLKGRNAFSVKASHFDNPRCRLLKYYARGTDAEKSPCMIISNIADDGCEPVLWRHIISVAPLDSLSLMGLGQALEEAEQAKENRMEKHLYKGRERLGAGKGRFGFNVSSPWYDGSGHQFTIVDSPSISVGSKSLIASQLSPEEVRNVLLSFSCERWLESQ